MDIRFDTYYTNEDLNARLVWLADQYPQILELRSLGKSHEGRDIPLVVLTNRQNGPDAAKPAFWIDANIHATELAASIAALYFVTQACATYGQDTRITRVLDEQVVYVVPRLNPDGAALALSAQPRYVRSGTRHYPYEDRQDGLHAQDIDGDGRLLQMRIPDPAGDWKVSEKDPRLMAKRGPDEEGDTYYRLLPEGLITGYDGHIITLAPPLEGLDFNRNFPSQWRPEGEQDGSGEYPGSEPEIRAVMAFVAQHPNIFGAITYHTFSRAILRPLSYKSDDEMDVEDRWVYEAIGDRGTELTGYPNLSVYHHFRYHPKEVTTGAFDDWMYEHKGVYAFTIELWDLPSAAGVVERHKEKKFAEWFRKHPESDDHKIVDYVNQYAPEKLAAWYPFQHPQLGQVELGGWDSLYSWRNPPPALLESEIAPQFAFAVAFAMLAPRLVWRSVQVTALGSDDYYVLAVIENRGFLPTNVSNQAKKTKAVRPVRIELDLPAGASLRGGKARQEVGHLEGRSNKLEVAYNAATPSDNRTKAEWVVHAPQGGELVLRAIAERGGTIRRGVELGV